MSELSAWAIAGLVQSAGAGNRDPAAHPGAELVSRCEPARFVLGPGTRLSSHGAHLDELRPARSFAPRARGRSGEPLATASGESPCPKGRFAGIGLGYHRSGRASALATERRRRARRDGRSTRAKAPAG